MTTGHGSGAPSSFPCPVHSQDAKSCKSQRTAGFSEHPAVLSSKRKMIKKCLFQSISKSSSKEGEALMRQIEQDVPGLSFKSCKVCLGYNGYAPTGNGHCDYFQERTWQK